MPRRIQKRRKRATESPIVALDRAAFEELVRELPEWLAENLLFQRQPERGSANARLLVQLEVDPGFAPHRGLRHRSQLAALWRAHRRALLKRWEAAPGDLRLGPWGERVARDPLNPDPRRLLCGAA